MSGVSLMDFAFVFRFSLVLVLFMSWLCFLYLLVEIFFVRFVFCG